MSEIVVVEPIHFEQGESSTARQQHHHHHDEYDYEYDNSMAITNNSVSSSSNGEQLQSGPFESERLPPVFGYEIQRFLRVANLLEREEPRVAYLCRVHAFVIAHNLDKNSSGRGVRQFKTSLLRRLEQDENATKRGGIGDIRELKHVYPVYRDYFARNNKDRREYYASYHIPS